MSYRKMSMLTCLVCGKAGGLVHDPGYPPPKALDRITRFVCQDCGAKVINDSYKKTWEVVSTMTNDLPERVEKRESYFAKSDYALEVKGFNQAADIANAIIERKEREIAELKRMLDASVVYGEEFKKSWEELNAKLARRVDRERILQASARAYCTEKNKEKVLDPDLLVAVVDAICKEVGK